LQYSVYNFEDADVSKLWEHFNSYEAEAQALLARAGKLLADEKASAKEKRRFPILSTYELALKCSNLFNLLDARGAISVTERVGMIGRIAIWRWAWPRRMRRSKLPDTCDSDAVILNLPMLCHPERPKRSGGSRRIRS